MGLFGVGLQCEHSTECGSVTRCPCGGHGQEEPTGLWEAVPCLGSAVLL